MQNEKGLNFLDKSIETRSSQLINLPLINSNPPDRAEKTEKPLPTIENLEYIFERYGINLYYDEISKERTITIPGVTCKNDLTDNGLMEHIRSIVARNEYPEKIIDRLPALFMSRTVNPVLQFLTSEKWDGKSRLQEIYDTVHVKNSLREYRDKALKCWLVQCAAAADFGLHSPIEHKISKFECVLVFQGAQGAGKTRWLRSLVPSNYHRYILDSVTLDLSDKDSKKAAVSAWLTELGEIDSTFKKQDIARLKGFLSSTVDIMRLPYDRMHCHFPRRTSFFASVNESRFLVDETGNRRFLSIAVGGVEPASKINLHQLWAEIWHLYIKGEQWWPDEYLKELMEESHEEHIQVSPIEDAVSTYFNLSVRTDIGVHLSCTEILRSCGWSTINKSDINQLANLLRRKGFFEKRTGSKRGFLLKKRD